MKYSKSAADNTAKDKNRYPLLFGIGAVLIAVSIYISYVVTNDQMIMLSEVCPHNDTVIYDKYGSYSDYIELYNDSDRAISLKGYFLSDNKDNLKLYTLPEVSIDAKGYLILWAASATEDNELLLTANDLYSGFSLANGDTLYLTNPEGFVIDKVKLPQTLASDISYSYTSSMVWEPASPTPGMANADGVMPPATVIDAIPFFSREAGFYDDDFELEISHYAGTDVEIFYTLDGTDPRDNGTKYTDPIIITNVSDNPNRYVTTQNISVRGGYYIPDEDTPIDKCVVVRAICRDADGNWGAEEASSYFVGYKDNPAYKDIAVVSLISNPENLFGYENGIYVAGKVFDDNKENMANTEGFNSNKPFANYFMAGKGWRRDTHIELFDADRTLLRRENMQLGIQGNYSTNHNQKSFALFKKESKGAEPNRKSADDKGVLDGIISSGSTSLSLRAGGNKDLYSTKIRDAFAQSLVKNRTVGSLRAVPCQVFVDGEYWGFYNLEERVDPGYVCANYGLSADNVILLKYGHVLAGEESDLQKFADLVNYAATHDLSRPKDYEYMCEHIDIQNYIEYNCFEIYVGNTDSVDCNYAYWRSKEISANPYCDGKWRWILYDTDDSSGVVEDEMSESYVDHFTAGHWAVNPLDDVLFKNLLENQTFKEQFLETFVDMADNDFAADMVVDKLDCIEGELAEPITASMKRYKGPDYSKDDYFAAMDKLKAYYRERRDYIVDYMYEDLGR